MPIQRLTSSEPTDETDIYRRRCEHQQQLICELWQDVLALKEHKQHYTHGRDLLQTLIDNMPDYIFIKDKECRFVLNNKAHLRLLNVSSESEAKGKTDFDFFPPQLAAHYFGDDQIVLKYGTPIIDREEKTLGRNGADIWLSSTKVPLRDSDGKITGIVGISRDLTHRKRAEEEQARLEEQLRQAQKLESLGRLTGGIAHDFNNMLCAIRGYTELIMRELDPPEGKLLHHLNAIEKAAVCAADLTRKLLAFARKGSCQMATIDLHETIETVIDLLSRTIDRRITIHRRLDAQTSTIIADRALIENALLNIAVNSRDAMPGGGTLVFQTLNIDIRDGDERCQRLFLPPGTYVIVSIVDTGIGMDKMTLDRIFEPFFTTKEQGKGTGLGLASVYGTVKSHNGAVGVESEVGRGTTVTIYLQAVQTETQQETPALFPVEIPRRGTILIVDDEELIRDMTSSLLQEQGYHTEACADGLEAVEYYRDHQSEIDLVVVDMIMPKLGGPDCIIGLRRINPAVKCIVMSGFSKPEETSRIPAKGVFGFLQKPFDRGDLLRMVGNALQMKPG